MAPVQKWLGLTSYSKEMLNGVISDNVGSKSKGDIEPKHPVAALNKVIWRHRC